MKVNADIKDSRHTFIEPFDVVSLKTAKKEIQYALDYFNSTLKLGETKRKLLKIHDNIIIENLNFSMCLKIINKWLGLLRREDNNVFGAAWAKCNINKVRKGYTVLIEKGKLISIVNLINQCPDFLKVFDLDKISSNQKLIEEEICKLKEGDEYEK